MDDLSSESIDEITELIFSGRKVQAIKRYRELRGTSLREAKKFIESLTAQLQETSPERFSSPSGQGCSPAILAVLAATAMSVAALIWFV